MCSLVRRLAASAWPPHSPQIRPSGKRPTSSDRMVVHFSCNSSTASLERCNEMEACSVIQAHSGKSRRGRIASPHAPKAGALDSPRRWLHRSSRTVAAAKGLAWETRFTRAAPWRASRSSEERPPKPSDQPHGPQHERLLPANERAPATRPGHQGVSPHAK